METDVYFRKSDLISERLITEALKSPNQSASFSLTDCRDAAEHLGIFRHLHMFSAQRCMMESEKSGCSATRLNLQEADVEEKIEGEDLRKRKVVGVVSFWTFMDIKSRLSLPIKGRIMRAFGGGQEKTADLLMQPRSSSASPFEHESVLRCTFLASSATSVMLILRKSGQSKEDRKDIKERKTLGRTATFNCVTVDANIPISMFCQLTVQVMVQDRKTSPVEANPKPTETTEAAPISNQLETC
ncbi:uncharacterized protein V6R79_006383 [Siganus canaliculatus]